MAKRNTSSNQMSLFPERVYEYHILLSPSEDIKEAVDGMKQQLHEMIGISQQSRNSIAHISLHTFEAYESVNVKSQVKKVLEGESAFTVKINGYSHFVNGANRTLYLAIENPEPVDYLAAIIKKPAKKKQPAEKYRQTSIIDRPVRKPKPTIIPHITIAGSISATDFNRIADFTPFDFKGEWLCDRVIIRRRLAGSTGMFSPAGEVKLG